MIVQDFYIGRYGWHVRVYYAVTTYWAGWIAGDLERIGCRGDDLERACRSLESGDLNTGITYSNNRMRETVMVIPYGEEEQYLSGEIGQKMFPVAKRFLCEHCRKGMKGRRRFPER